MTQKVVLPLVHALHEEAADGDLCVGRRTDLVRMHACLSPPGEGDEGRVGLDDHPYLSRVKNLLGLGGWVREK